MPPPKTYTYTQDGHEEGPYFESQIIKMAEAGIIRADAVIKCVQDGASGPLRGFLDAMQVPESITGSVIVSDLRMPFSSMVAFMVKWAIAAIPAAVILVLVIAAFMTVFGGVFGGLSTK